MDDFVEDGVAKVHEAFAGVSNPHPSHIARVIFEHIATLFATHVDDEPEPDAPASAAKTDTPTEEAPSDGDKQP